jgi:glycerol-3-phosphate dehydrogenase
MFDVIVIGGGVVGGLILRELTKYKLNVCLLEKEGDVAMGASKANSGIVHAGFDAPIGSLKAKFNVEGNKMMEGVCAELGVKFRRNGSLVVAFTEEDCRTLNDLKARGEVNGVADLEIIDQAKLREMEKNISDNALAALYAPTGGIVCPYELTIASIGNAMDNGAKLITDFEVSAIEKTENGYLIKSSDGQEVETKFVINCAGLYSGKIAKMVGDLDIQIGARKGEYILLDRESGDFVSHTLFFTPTKLGKGILVTQTVDGNILLGPTAEEGNTNTETSVDGLAFVIKKARKNVQKRSIV